MIKGSIQGEDITIVNRYAPNRGAPQYVTQTLRTIKGEIESHTIIVGALTPHFLFLYSMFSFLKYLLFF